MTWIYFNVQRITLLCFICFLQCFFLGYLVTSPLNDSGLGFQILQLMSSDREGGRVERKLTINVARCHRS